MRGHITLGIDCGGGGIKASVVGSSGTLLQDPLRTATPYPLPPGKLVDLIADLASQLRGASRVTVGMPGMIRRGVVVATPHYVCREGPRTKVVPELVKEWSGFDMGAALTEALGLPTLVLNDAEVHGCGIVTGTGLEMVLTMGTGLGNAIFDDGVLAPHNELSQAPVKWGLTYDEYLGEHERIRLGDAHWSRRVRRVIESFEPVYRWDRLYLGGGNARRITPSVLARLGGRVILAPNTAGITGGVRAWSLLDPS